jgi:hypothetical protein
LARFLVLAMSASAWRLVLVLDAPRSRATQCKYDDGGAEHQINESGVGGAVLEIHEKRRLAADEIRMSAPATE